MLKATEPNTTTRRLMLRGVGITAIATAALPAAITARATGPTNPDAELIAACEHFVALEAVRARTCWAESGDFPDRPGRAAALAEFGACCARQEEVTAMLSATKATTLEGLKAKARAAIAWYDGDPIDDGAGGDVAWSLLLDLAGEG